MIKSLIGWYMRRSLPAIKYTGGVLTVGQMVGILTPFINNPARLDSQGSTYKAIRRDWILETHDYFNSWLQVLDLGHYRYEWQCNNYAESWWMFVQVCHAQQNKAGSELPACGYLKHLNPGHACNFVITEQGFEVWDSILGFVPWNTETYDIRF